MKAFFERCAKLQGPATTDFCSANTYKKTQQRSFKADPKSLLKTWKLVCSTRPLVAFKIK
jgi:hypothetical protein